MATHIDIANAILAAHNIRENSYVKANNPMDLGDYAKSPEDAAKEACANFPEIEDLVSTLLYVGYSELWEWVKEHKTI
jgi:hypothetical protein